MQFIGKCSWLRMTMNCVVVAGPNSHSLTNTTLMFSNFTSHWCKRTMQADFRNRLRVPNSSTRTNFRYCVGFEVSTRVFFQTLRSIVNHSLLCWCWIENVLDQWSISWRRSYTRYLLKTESWPLSEHRSIRKVISSHLYISSLAPWMVIIMYFGYGFSIRKFQNTAGIPKVWAAMSSTWMASDCSSSVRIDGDYSTRANRVSFAAVQSCIEGTGHTPVLLIPVNRYYYTFK